MLKKLRTDHRHVYSLALLLLAPTAHCLATRTLTPIATPLARSFSLNAPAPTTVPSGWHRRQQNDGAISLITADINTTVPTATTSDSDEPLTTTSLIPATGPLEIWATMGLIMPNPYDKIYTSESGYWCRLGVKLMNQTSAITSAS